MSTNCSDNSSCWKGTCCEVFSTSPNYLTCTTNPTRCYTLDNTYDVNVSCEDSSECATECCQSLCVAENTNCQVAPVISTTLLIALIVSGVLLLLLISMIVLCCCCEKQKRKRKKISQVKKRLEKQLEKKKNETELPDTPRDNIKSHQIFSKINLPPRKNNSTAGLNKMRKNEPNQRKSARSVVSNPEQKTEVSQNQSLLWAGADGRGEFEPIIEEPKIKNQQYQQYKKFLVIEKS